MQEKNNQNTIKILIGIIIGLSVFILLGGIFYIFNMQSKKKSNGTVKKTNGKSKYGFYSVST